MTMDKVARRAGTNKNTLYRRWPNRAALGVAAYRHLAEAQTPVPDTGTLRGEYALRGVPAVSDTVLTEIVDEVFLPLVRGRAPRA